ncbi:MAG TPA: MFS transporter [Steroidobacteraceae bacterium]|nr:MFS transporter [Steroidobacteraceae bacterium]
MTQSGTSSHRSFAALRQPGYRGFFFSSAGAMMADNIEHVISYWVIFNKFHSAALGGFAVVAHWLPYLLFSIHAGALTERFDARRVIQCGMLMFMGVSISWGVLFATDTIQMWHAMVLLVVHGIAGVLWSPASQVLLYHVVPMDHLPSAVRLNATARQLGMLAGPAVGGAILLVLGPVYGIFFNALLYLPTILWLWKAPYDPSAMPRTRALLGFRDIAATLKQIVGHRTLASMILLAGAASLFVGNAYQAQMPGFAHALGQTHADFFYSMLLGADAAGALTAGLILESRGLLQPRARTAFVLAMVWCCALAGFAMSPFYALALVLLFAAGFSELSFNSMAQTLVQLNAPHDIRGRVIGVFTMSAMGLRTFSGVTVGLMGSLIGIHASLAVSAAALLTLSLTLLLVSRAAPRREAAVAD